jgi:L-alanine-DL-glutamate epimerase-like enolase superfamily enzyme
MKLSWQIIQLNFKNNFAIAHGNYSFRNALVVSLDHNNFKGFGECTIIDYYNISSEKLLFQISTIQNQIENSKIITPQEFYLFLKTLNISIFLCAALDCAYWDLFGKLENKNFLDLNNLKVTVLPKSTITISVAPIKEQLAEIKKLNWTSYKVKCNHFNNKDILQLQQLEVPIAIDANGSFTFSDCVKLDQINISKPFTYIEQPLKIGIENYSKLSDKDISNWMADEDFQSDTKLSDLKSHYKSINIKLLKCGGITPALQTIKIAKKMGFKVMIGCMTESTIGISAAAVLSPLCDFADLDGANLIANDLANGSIVEKGEIKISQNPGLGIELF